MRSSAGSLPPGFWQWEPVGPPVSTPRPRQRGARSRPNCGRSPLASRRWHVPAAAVSIAAGFAVHPLAAAAVAAGLLLAARRRRRAYDEVNATLSAMLETYLSLNTTDLSWPHVTATLARSQSAGAIWDASLYALADRRTRRSQDEHAFS